MSGNTNYRKYAPAIALSAVLISVLSGMGVAGVGGGGGIVSANLTVITNVVGGTAAAGNFTIYVIYANGTNVTGSPFQGSASGITFKLAPGSYSVSEAPFPNYNESIGGSCALNGSITLVNGSSYTCTFTNTYVPPVAQPAHIDVIEKVIGGPATANQFAINVTGNSPVPSMFSGSATGTIVTIGQGNYSVYENRLFVYNESGRMMCGGRGKGEFVAGYYNASYSDCSGMINSGQNLTCTITSTFVKVLPLSVRLVANATDIDLGKSVGFTATVTGGVSPYTYEVLVQKPSSRQFVASVNSTDPNSDFTPTGQNGTTTGTVKFTETPAQVGDYIYEIVVTDSAKQTALATQPVYVGQQSICKVPVV